MHEPKKAVGIIPARFSSTRFPGKPLVEIGGKTMIQRVYEQAQKATLLDYVVVASDDSRILEHVEAFGGHAMRTRADHVSGTDRCAEVISYFTDYQVVINIQGDEPFLNPTQIDLVARPLLERNARITTLAKQLHAQEALENPNIVKVVFDQKARALYFSRYPIPFLRNTSIEDALQQGVFFKHIGLYGFQRETLLEVTQLPVSRLEQLESLEQLRWLDHGYPIQIQFTDIETIGIDTPEDLVRARALLG